MGGWVGDKLSRRASAEGAEADLNPAVESALKGRTSGGKRPLRISVCGGTDSPGGTRLCSRASHPRASRPGSGGVNGKRASASREARIPGEAQVPEDENSTSVTGQRCPDGAAGRKPSRARETPRTEGGGHLAWPASTGSATPHALKEQKAQEGAVQPHGWRRSSGVPWRGARGYERRCRRSQDSGSRCEGEDRCRRKRLAGSAQASTALLFALNLCKPAQPHEGQSGAGDGDLLARADPDSRGSDLEP